MLILMIACVTQDNYVAKAGHVVCRRSEECDKGAFDSRYDSVGGCQDKFVAYWGSWADCMSVACTFDAQGGADCISAYRDATCEQYVNGDPVQECDGAWVDCDDIAALACLEYLVQ